MRKFLLAAALSAGALGLNVGQASAGFFGCCGFRKCCSKCCTFCVKPYNAFSPVCFGNVCFSGCCPWPQACYNNPCPPQPGFCGGGYCGDGACGGGCGPGANFLPGSDTAPTTGTPPTRTPGGKQYTPPMPSPLGNGAGARAYSPARSFTRPAGYYPYSYPAYPMVPMSAPSYWNQH